MEKIVFGIYETSNFSKLMRQQQLFVRVFHRKLRKTIHPAYLLAYYSTVYIVKLDSEVLCFLVQRQRSLYIDPKTQFSSWVEAF